MSIESISYYYSLWGEEFTPTPFLTQEQFEVIDYHRVGDIGKKGRYKGKAFDSGYLAFRGKQRNWEECLKDLMPLKDLIIETKADSKVLYISLGYIGQCNWEFDPVFLSRLSELGFTLAISCYEAEEQETNDK